MRAELVVSAAAAALLAGCAAPPVMERPEVELPVAWSALPTGAATTEDRWWRYFADPALEQLIEEAFAHNQDLVLAVARVDEARALLEVAGASRLPAVDGDVQRDRTRSSARSSMPLPPGTPLERDTYRAQLNVAYEVDLWGRLSGAAAAARAELLASSAARDTVRITLAAEVARSYFALLALDAQIETTARAIRLRADNLHLQRVRLDAGLGGELEIRQLEAELAAARAQLPALERARTGEELALGVLLGRNPRALFEDPVTRGNPGAQPLAPVVPEGLPSELLLRRPDIVAAEQRLIAAHARIGVARASLFPRIVLTGHLGSESASLGELFSAPARIWQLAFALTQPIFQGGRLSGEIEAVRARERQALAGYQKTVQESFREVREALSAQTRSREIFEAESARVEALREALRLARIRHESGLESQLAVIDAERNLLAAELARIDALRAQRAAVADLVRALGGGWGGPDAPVPPARGTLSGAG